jgi:hypothetical protein
VRESRLLSSSTSKGLWTAFACAGNSASGFPGFPYLHVIILFSIKLLIINPITVEWRSFYAQNVRTFTPFVRMFTPNVRTFTPFVRTFTPFVRMFAPFVRTFAPFVRTFVPFVHTFVPFVHTFVTFVRTPSESMPAKNAKMRLFAA